jgi:hypothetical protein
MTPFVYCSLDRTKREIRLLRLLPNDSGQQVSTQNNAQPCGAEKTTSKQDLIQCTIEKTSLDDGPEYVALSYTWGDISKSQSIVLNGSIISITVNLFEALTHLRNACDALWVDALCINQRDNEEKSWQVEQMRLVYQHASKAIIWLGPAADDSDVAMDAVNIIGKEAVACNIQSLKRSEMLKIWTDLMASETPIVKEPVHQLLYNISARPSGAYTFPLPAMTALLSRPWWKRIWVRQELAVASKAVFVCGQCKASIESFAAALWLFEAHSQYVYTKGL